MRLSVGSKIKNSISLLRQGKIDKLLDAIAWSVPQWLFYYSHSVLVVTEKPNWTSHPHPDYRIRNVRPEDIQFLAKDGFTDEKILSRINAGDKGILMEKNNEVHSIVWGASGKKFLKLVGAEFDPGDDGFIIYGAYTDEKARGKGLFYELGTEMYALYANRGFTKVWGAINANNRAWLDKFCSKMNFEKAGETFYFKLLFMNICYYKSWPYPTGKFRIFFKNPPQNMSWV